MMNVESKIWFADRPKTKKEIAFVSRIHVSRAFDSSAVKKSFVVLTVVTNQSITHGQ